MAIVRRFTKGTRKMINWNLIKITVGKDVSAYATLAVPQGTVLDEDTLKELAKHADFSEVFDVDWSTSSSLRIVDVSNSDNQEDNTICDVAIEPAPHDIGVFAIKFLKGEITSTEFVLQAISCGLNPGDIKI
jgi:hypothetical protein